jgi:8-oxo-dGTP pyrophosphatase MutT (NUDIX family)
MYLLAYTVAMHIIDFHTRIPGKKQAAFVIFYASDGKPWLNYVNDKHNRTNLVIPTALMMNRADGLVGFIGGGVEERETLEEAAVREVREEIGHAVTSSLEPLVAHELDVFTTHAFTSQVPYAQLRDMQKQAEKAEHFGSETTGVFLPHLINYDLVSPRKKGGVKNLLTGSLAPTVREELAHFLLAAHIFTLDELTALCHEAGFSLQELLR